MWAIQGCAAQMGPFFTRNPLKTWVHFSEEKPLDMGPFFQNVQNFGCFLIQNFYNFWVFAINRPIFQEKYLEMDTFGKNDPLKRIRVSRLGRHIPVQIKSEYPPEMHPCPSMYERVHLWANFSQQIFYYLYIHQYNIENRQYLVNMKAVVISCNYFSCWAGSPKPHTVLLYSSWLFSKYFNFMHSNQLLCGTTY